MQYAWFYLRVLILLKYNLNFVYKATLLFIGNYVFPDLTLKKRVSRLLRTWLAGYFFLELALVDLQTWKIIVLVISRLTMCQR